MPQLKDCRGKIVLMPESGDFVNTVGGFKGGGDMFTGDNKINYTDPTSYKYTAAEQITRITNSYAEMNGTITSGFPSMPTRRTITTSSGIGS